MNWSSYSSSFAVVLCPYVFNASTPIPLHMCCTCLFSVFRFSMLMWPLATHQSPPLPTARHKDTHEYYCCLHYIIVVPPPVHIHPVRSRCLPCLQKHYDKYHITGTSSIHIICVRTGRPCLCRITRRPPFASAAVALSLLYAS